MSNKAEQVYWRIINQSLETYDIPATAYHMANFYPSPYSWIDLAMEVESQALRRKLYPESVYTTMI